MNVEELEKIVVQCLEAACAFKKPVANVKIVSSGQTGVGRGALEAAMALGLDFGRWATHGWITEDGTIPWGVIVPHRNRTRGLGVGAFTTGGTPVVPVAGETPATPIKGKMPVVPVTPRRWRRSQLGCDKRGPSRNGQDARCPSRRSRGDRPTGGRSP